MSFILFFFFYFFLTVVLPLILIIYSYFPLYSIFIPLSLKILSKTSNILAEYGIIHTHNSVCFLFSCLFSFLWKMCPYGTTFVSVQKHKKRRHCFKITQIFILINSTAMYVLFHLYKKNTVLTSKEMG